MCKHLFDLRVLEIMVLFAIIFIRSKYPLNMEEIMDLWISNWRFSLYEKFTSIFLIFKYSRNWIRENRFVSSKFPRYLLKLRLDIFLLCSSCVQLRIQFSQNRTMTHSFRFIGLGHANSATSLVYLLNEIEFWLLLSSLVTNGIIC